MNLRIVLITDSFYPNIGGTERLVQQFYEILSKNNTVGVFTLSRKTSVYSTTTFKVGDLENKMRKELSDINPDIIILFCDIYSQFLNRTSEIYKNYPTISVLNHNEESHRKYLNIPAQTSRPKTQVVQYMKSLFEGVDEVVVFSESDSVKDILKDMQIQGKYIENFVMDAEPSKPFMRKKYGISKNKKVIFYHGRAESKKNLSLLILHFEKFAKESNYHLCLMAAANNNQEKTYLQQCIAYCIRSPVLKGRVTFLPQTSEVPKVYSCLMDSDLFFLPSSSEGSPLTIQEAMACGTPWVSTPVGQVPNIYSNSKSGKILNNINFDHKDFVQKVTEAIEIPREVVRKEWEDKFHPQNSVREYTKIIEKIISEK